MEKIKFSEGGQPVFLDDLALMQDNCFALISFLQESMTGKKEPILLSDFNPLLESINSDGTVNIAVPGNEILYEGLLADIPEATFNKIDNKTTIYVSIAEEDSQLRTFQNSDSLPVRTSISAALTTSKPAKGFAMDELRTFSGVKQLQVLLLNGYVGYVRVKDNQLLISIETSQDTWTNEDYILFVIQDQSWVSALANQEFDVDTSAGSRISFDSSGKCTYGYTVGAISPYHPPEKIQITLNITR
ncbi:MAG: hypothetical protein IKB97_02370 [Bacteroidaceae bacterium]|nr:hypothetical protein [Bacteroidaceae bacterium]